MLTLLKRCVVITSGEVKIIDNEDIKKIGIAHSMTQIADQEIKELL